MALSSTRKMEDQDVPVGKQIHDRTPVPKQETVLELKLCLQNLADLNTKLQKEYHTITTLKLDFNNLLTLPDGLVQCFPNLKVLHANGNSLTCLPSDFGSLTSLTDVELKENELTYLPDSVQYLFNLQRFQLTGNRLTSLPEDFGEMVHLEELFIDENQLTKLPPTFALMDRLRILEAGHNSLCVLPKYFGNLRSLTHLSICNNKLEEMPESFCELENLVILDVSRNFFRALPEKCSSQKTLEKVFADYNILLTVPEWLGQLPELTELCLKNNVIGSGLPDDIGKVCKKLRHLDLRGNNMPWLPDSFGELECLEWAHFGSHHDLVERRIGHANGNWLSCLPTSFPQLSRLTTLRLDENHLQFLPEDFGCLHCLEYLDLGHNTLHDLPESFGNLTKLRVCILSINGLQLLPSTFGQLTTLQELRLDFNELAELPRSFRNLRELKILDLFENKLTEVPDYVDQFVHLQFLDLGRNHFKIPNSQVPSILKGIVYKPPTEYPPRTWRGIFRPDRLRHRHFIKRKVHYEEEELDNPWMSKNSQNSVHFKGSQEDVHSASSSIDESYQNEGGFNWGGPDQKSESEQAYLETGSQDEHDQACAVPSDTSAVTEEENWCDNGNVQGPVFPTCIPAVPEEENWEDDCDNPEMAYQSSYFLCPRQYLPIRRSSFYMCPWECRVPDVKRLDIFSVNQEPEESQFSDADDNTTSSGTISHINTDEAQNTDADNVQADTNTTNAEFSTGAVNTLTVSGDGTAVSHTMGNSPVTTGSKIMVSPLIPCDLHPPSLIRSRHFDSNYQEPEPVIGQFSMF